MCLKMVVYAYPTTPFSFTITLVFIMEMRPHIDVIRLFLNTSMRKAQYTSSRALWCQALAWSIDASPSRVLPLFVALGHGYRANNGHLMKALRRPPTILGKSSFAKPFARNLGRQVTYWRSRIRMPSNYPRMCNRAHAWTMKKCHETIVPKWQM
jgi:hypothetical protein